VSLSQWYEEDDENELCSINRDFYSSFNPEGEGTWNTLNFHFKIDEHGKAYHVLNSDSADGHVVLMGGTIIWGNALARRLLHDKEGNNFMRKCTLITPNFCKHIIDIINKQGSHIFLEKEYVKFEEIIKL
jgi:hypothetical protein